MTKQIWSEFVRHCFQYQQGEISEQELNDFKQKHKSTYEVFCKEPITEERLQILDLKPYVTPENLEGYTFKKQAVLHFGAAGWELYKIKHDGTFLSLLDVPQYLVNMGQVIDYCGIADLLNRPPIKNKS